MRFSCRPVDARFLDDAPWRFRASAEIPAAGAAVFRTLEDAVSWPDWFPGIQAVTLTSPEPMGVGTTRTVRVPAVVAYEHFFRWETGARFSFYVVAHRALMRMFDAMAEDYVVESMGPGRCRFIYSVGIEPSALLSLSGALGRSIFGRVVRAVPEHLARFVTQPRATPTQTPPLPTGR
jgi:hypothetical protein